mgnify:FL=1
MSWPGPAMVQVKKHERKNMSTWHNTMNSRIDETVKSLRKEIRNYCDYGTSEKTGDRKRWRRSYWNQPGVYDVQLNLQQIRVINIALVNLNKKDRAAFPTHLRQKWVTMVKEIFEDWEERKKQPPRKKPFNIYNY